MMRRCESDASFSLCTLVERPLQKLEVLNRAALPASGVLGEGHVQTRATATTEVGVYSCKYSTFNYF